MNDQTITIYNYDGEKHQRTVLRGVSFHFGYEKEVSSSGKATRTQVLDVIIPVGARASDGRSYIEYPRYMNLENTEAYWTLNPASKKDVVVCGECSDEIREDFKYTALINSHMKAGVICSVADNTDVPLLKHYKVVAK